MTHQSVSYNYLSEDFLTRLVAELDKETVRAIILRGSYVRGDAFPPYSDVDLTIITQDTVKVLPPKYYIWREGYAVSISTWSIASYRERIQRPEEAIFAVPGIQEARILLEKDDAFREFQRDVQQFRWEPLQAAANEYAGQVMMEQTEIVLKSLKALHMQDALLLADVLTLDLLPAVTEAFVVQRGLLIKSGNTYFHQAQEAAGQHSTWTHYHQIALGIHSDVAPSLVQRSIASLHLFQETAHLLFPFFQREHREAIEPLIEKIGHYLASKEIG
ncbi:nucleotidyltransferase domain-containing protein [Ktedonospora formicarum]|uniref:Polymerase nucleotidyl transferase domain-containing protein n=1 Tax=Ktedonospora formicarum TaxID=2778364 RepID=A0A8J3MW48_9CHLR|nr:nucleotidyltransferase domain-containing protein [Ktedonospora formicarum]GHO48581.1 hypothetical protein KSX_67440 [Ktedonospora formicarum]